MLSFEFKSKNSKPVGIRPENISFENENFIFESFELDTNKDYVFNYSAMINERIDFSKPFIFKFWLNNIYNKNYLIEAKFD